MTQGPQPPRHQRWDPAAGVGGFRHGQQPQPPNFYLSPGGYPAPPPPPRRHRLALVTAAVAGAALLLCLLVNGLGVFLGLVALVLGAVALVRVRGGRRPGKRLVIGALVGALLAVIIGSATAPPVEPRTEQASQRDVHSAASTTPVPTQPSPSPSSTPAPPPAPVALVVSHVIDGDTFVVGADTIRVLGIDSCEASTDAGPAATAEATQLLAAPVVLTTQPGVDRDAYGRLLRYVRLGDGQDFARVMVAAPHTAVYSGRNDADPGYVASLQAADPNGRTCNSPKPPPPTPTTTQRPYVPYVPEPDTYVPNPEPYVAAPKRRTGHSGHPCLPGERDGDGDGYCGEK